MVAMRVHETPSRQPEDSPRLSASAMEALGGARRGGWPHYPPHPPHHRLSASAEHDRGNSPTLGRTHQARPPSPNQPVPYGPIRLPGKVDDPGVEAARIDDPNFAVESRTKPAPLTRVFGSLLSGSALPLPPSPGRKPHRGARGQRAQSCSYDGTARTAVHDAVGDSPKGRPSTRGTELPWSPIRTQAARGHSGADNSAAKPQPVTPPAAPCPSSARLDRHQTVPAPARPDA